MFFIQKLKIFYTVNILFKILDFHPIIFLIYKKIDYVKIPLSITILKLAENSKKIFIFTILHENYFLYSADK